MKTNKLVTIASLLMIVLFAGCEKDDFEENFGVCPLVVSTDPANGDTNVPLDKIITVTFNEEMNPATITQGAITIQGQSEVAGTITYDQGTFTATFTPSEMLTANTTYVGIVKTSVKDLDGNALQEDYVWTFSTGTTVSPMVIATNPANGETAVVLNKVIIATFSQPMDPATLDGTNGTTFTLQEGTNPVTGVITYSGNTAFFNPSSDLLPDTQYTATITTGATSASGIPLQTNYQWVFTTGTSAAALPNLGTIADFGGFGGDAGLTNQGLNTVINGSIGTTAASTLVTGFHDGLTGDIYTETPLNVGLVTGGIFTAPPAPGTATSFAIAQQALLDAQDLYNAISPAAMPGGSDPGAGELGGLVLPPGVYKSASGTFNISNGDLTLDAQGDPNALWVFQTASGLTVGIAGPAGAKSVNLINGANAANVFWQVGSAATINAAGGGTMVGTIVSMSGVTLSTAGNAAQTVLNGRAISLVASVTMVNTTINVPN